MQEKTKNVKNGVEIDLQKLLLAYLHKWWLIGLSALLVGSIFLFYTMNFVTPMYRSSVTIIVNSKSADQIIEEITGTNLAASQRLVNTYMNIIRSETVLSRVAQAENLKEKNLEFSVQELREMMTARQMDETQMFEVFVTHADPEVAAEVANAIGMESLAIIEEKVEGSSAKVVDLAQVSTERYSPSYSRSGIVGGAIGGVIAILYVTLRYLLDVRLKTSEDLETLFELPVLGQIPVFVSAENKSKSGYGYQSRKSGYGYEAAKTSDEDGKER